MKSFETQLEETIKDLPIGTKIKHKLGVIEIKNVKRFSIVNQEPFSAKGICYGRFFLVLNGVQVYTKL